MINRFSRTSATPVDCVASPRDGRGFTLIELMVALTIGLFMLGGLVSVFANSSRNHTEFANSTEQTENGAFAVRILSEDLTHAGYYGEFFAIPAPGTAAPDPCALTATALFDALAFPVQGFDAPLISPLACLGSNDLVPGTDILVIRRVDMTALTPASVPTANEVYLQASSAAAEVQFGANGAAIGTTKKADGTTATLFKRDGVSAADIRKYMVRIYFVAPCSVPANGGSSCAGAADDGGNPIPTLKRLELASIAGVTGWRIVPLVEGIQDFQVDYGIDNAPAAVSLATGWPGDGAPDAFVTAPAATDWPNVVSAGVRLLARSTQPTPGHSDNKTYNMGLAGTLAASNDTYKRHLFANMVRLNNVSGRKEIPQ